MRILLVDDHTLFREGIRLLLQPLTPALEVEEAGSCEEALSLLASQAPFDLVLMDLGLPGQSGLDGKPFHHLMQVRGLILGNFPGAAHGQGDLIAEPVSHEVHDQGHKEGEVEPLSTRKRLPDH